jgi:hypothetical protein
MVDVACKTGSKRTGIRTAILAICIAIPGLACAQSLPRQRAGEWETQINGGMTRRACLHADLVMDQATVLRRKAMMHGAQCTMTGMHTAGPATSYDIACVINGKNHMTSHEVMTALAPDAYETRSHVHMDMGQIHDMDVVSVSRWLGPCKPGDAGF